MIFGKSLRSKYCLRIVQLMLNNQIMESSEADLGLLQHPRWSAL